MPNNDMLELVTSTLRDRRKKITNATTRHNALLFHLRRKGMIRTTGGGREINAPINYGENQNFQYYIGTETLNVSPQEVLTSAAFSWKQYACGVSISGRERRMNRGKSQIINMLDQRLKNCERTIANNQHKSAYGDGTAFSGKDFGGLQLLVGATAGATVGGLDSSVDTWWDNKRATVSGGPTAANIYENMLGLYMQLLRGSDRPDLIIADNTYYTAFDMSREEKSRYMDKGMANAGFANITFHGIPVVADGGDGGYMPVGMYFLDCSEMALVMHEDAYNSLLEGPNRPLTEDSHTAIMIGMGNYVMYDRARHGRLSNAA